MSYTPYGHSADYYNLAADMEGIHQELRTAVRGAWIRGALTATALLAVCGLGLYALAPL